MAGTQRRSSGRGLFKQRAYTYSMIVHSFVNILLVGQIRNKLHPWNWTQSDFYVCKPELSVRPQLQMLQET
jgi:hypothetical protein